jgi:hypothetical protein
MTSRCRTSYWTPSSTEINVRCARWLCTGCPDVSEGVGTLWRVLGTYIVTEVVRRQLAPFSSGGRGASNSETSRGARSDHCWCSVAVKHSYKSRCARSNFLRAHSSTRHCAVDFKMGVRASSAAVARRAAIMVPFRVNAWPGARKLSPSSPDT